MTGWLEGQGGCSAGTRLYWYAKIAALHGSQQTGATSTVTGHSIFLQALPKMTCTATGGINQTTRPDCQCCEECRLTRLQQGELIKRTLREQPVVNQPGIHLPFDDEHRHPIEGLLTDDTLVFKSKAMPLRLTFLTPSGTFLYTHSCITCLDHLQGGRGYETGCLCPSNDHPL